MQNSRQRPRVHQETNEWAGFSQAPAGPEQGGHLKLQEDMQTYDKIQTQGGQI
jgi:hypothetical protein